MIVVFLNIGYFYSKAGRDGGRHAPEFFTLPRELIEQHHYRLQGVYILCDGSMPVYIGRGRIASRITRHQRSKSRGQFWDHFSWYAIPDGRLEADVEALLLRMLPFYLRSLNKQRARFVDARRMTDKFPVADSIKRPSFAAKRRRR